MELLHEERNAEFILILKPSASYKLTQMWVSFSKGKDAAQALGVIDGWDHNGVEELLFARPLDWASVQADRGDRPLGALP